MIAGARANEAKRRFAPNLTGHSHDSSHGASRHPVVGGTDWAGPRARARRIAPARRFGQGSGSLLSGADDASDARRAPRSALRLARGLQPPPSRSISIEGLAGLPVFAGAVAGPLYMAGPTGGFLVGFLVAAALIGFAADRRWDRSWIMLLASLSLGHAVVFAFGFVWLAKLIGPRRRSPRASRPSRSRRSSRPCSPRAGRRWQERARADGPRLRRRDGMAADPDRQGPPFRAAFARFVSLGDALERQRRLRPSQQRRLLRALRLAVNAILIEAGLLDPASSPVIGLVVESNCRFYASLTYPEPAEVGVAVEHLGRSSVRYHLAVFKAGANEAAAAGRYTHVYVERATNRPVPIPEGHRRLMEALKAP